MRKFALVCSLTSLACISINAYAAEVEVTWQKPEKFTDIRPANESKIKYQQRVLKHFDGFFSDLAAKLPEEYRWHITVTDFDLAGDIDPFISGTGQELRIIKDIYSPAIQFSHTVINKHGEQIVNQEEKLRDMGFMQSLRGFRDNDEFRYEKQMIEQWFIRDLLPEVEAAQAKLPKVSSN
ncbi:DUF3016 domain-containing protein [Rheinheimera sp. WS51]|uniref:DUF3016 domain-containing protein n=1 Tax=Rheinheimera sp. WS51 TaxID=3425886 RepID=UPI003D8CE2A7